MSIELDSLGKLGVSEGSLWMQVWRLTPRPPTGRHY